MIRFLLLLFLAGIAYTQDISSAPQTPPTPEDTPAPATPAPTPASIPTPTAAAPAPAPAEAPTTPTDTVAISQRIPDLNTGSLSFIDNLNSTVWMSGDLQKKIDYYIFFNGSRQGAAAVPRNANPETPENFYPIKFIQSGNEPNSAIILVSSRNQLLYYSFRLITPYNLAISAGYNTIDPLLNWNIIDYFQNGYILQLIY